MRDGLLLICFAALAAVVWAQQAAASGSTGLPAQQPAAAPPKSAVEKSVEKSAEQSSAIPMAPDAKAPAKGSNEAKLNELFQAKIKAEWEALKHKDKKVYGDLLADDYQGVEIDGRGERNKLQAVNELAETNVFNYTLFGFKLIPAGPDAELVIYEVTMQFPPKSQVRYSRVYISELWEKRGGDWKEVHYQETHVK